MNTTVMGKSTEARGYYRLAASTQSERNTLKTSKASFRPPDWREGSFFNLPPTEHPSPKPSAYQPTMKFTSSLFAVATALLLAVSSLETASAVECTTDQTLANSAAILAMSTSSECAQFNTGTQSQAATCADTKCLDVLKKAIASFADCTMAGIDPKQTLNKAIASCPGSSAAASTKTSIVTVAATSTLAVFAMRM